LENFQGVSIEKAFPSMPVIVIGLESVPGVGEKFKVFSDIETAKREVKPSFKPVPEVLVVEPDRKVLNIILKVDVLGSLEAIEEILKNLPQDKVILRILKSGVGEIGEADVKLAKGANAKIIGFRVKTNPIAKSLAQRDRVKIVNFDVIYELSQAVRNFLEKIIEPEVVRVDLGKIKVLAIFRTEKNRQIVGGKVIDGEVKRGVSLDIYRGEEKAGSGKIIGLQRDKKVVEKAARGEECGILYEGNAKIEEGDILEAYTEEKRKPEL